MQRVIEVGVIGRNVAANLLRLRKARGLTVRALSAELARGGRSIPPSGLTRIELGGRRVDVDDLAALAAALKVEPSQLMLPPSALTIEIFVGTGGEIR